MKTPTVILSVLLTLSAGYALYLLAEINRLEQLLVAAEPPIEDVANENSPTEVEVAETESVESEPETVVQTGVEPSQEKTEPSNDRSSRRQEWMQRMMAAFDDPQMRVDMIERQMNRIDSRYADFFKSLDLPADDLDSLRTLLAEGGVLNWEMRMRSYNASSDEDKGLVDSEAQIRKEALESEIAALLGEETSSELDEFTESLPYRGKVEALASSLSFTDTPLTKDQSEQLVDSMRDVSNNFEYTKDLSGMRGHGVSDLSSEEVATYFQERQEYDARVLEAASETLNDSQLAAYAERQLAERERDQRQMEYMLANPSQRGPRF